MLTTPEAPVLDQPAAAKKSRRRPLLITAVVVAVVLILLIAANFAVVFAAQKRISDRLSCRLGDSADVDVSVAGGWNGLGILRGDLGDVRVTAKGAKAGATTADVEATAGGVQIHDKALTSTGGDLSATVAFADLSRQISASGGKDVEVKGYGGQLMMSGGGSGTTGIAGQLALLSTVAVEAHTLRLTPTAVVFGERQIPIDQARALLAARSPQSAQTLEVREIALTQLPASVQLSSATVGATGLTVRAKLTAINLTGTTPTAQGGCN